MADGGNTGAKKQEHDYDAGFDYGYGDALHEVKTVDFEKTLDLADQYKANWEEFSRGYEDGWQKANMDRAQGICPRCLRKMEQRLLVLVFDKEGIPGPRKVCINPECIKAEQEHINRFRYPPACIDCLCCWCVHAEWCQSGCQGCAVSVDGTGPKNNFKSWRDHKREMPLCGEYERTKDEEEVKRNG